MTYSMFKYAFNAIPEFRDNMLSMTGPVMATILSRMMSYQMTDMEKKAYINRRATLGWIMEYVTTMAKMGFDVAFVGSGAVELNDRVHGSGRCRDDGRDMNGLYTRDVPTVVLVIWSPPGVDESLLTILNGIITKMTTDPRGKSEIVARNTVVFRTRSELDMRVIVTRPTGFSTIDFLSYPLTWGSVRNSMEDRMSMIDGSFWDIRLPTDGYTYLANPTIASWRLFDIDKHTATIDIFDIETLQLLTSTSWSPGNPRDASQPPAAMDGIVNRPFRPSISGTMKKLAINNCEFTFGIRMTTYELQFSFFRDGPMTAII